MGNGNDYIRGQVEDLLKFRTPVTVMYNSTIVTGILNGMGPSGFWIRPIQLMYIPYQDTDSIRTADPDEVE